MLKTILKLLVGSVLLIAAQACAPLGERPPDPDAINTAIAQTSEALTQTREPGIPITGQESPTPTATSVVPTPTASLPVFTSTPAVPEIRVTVPTNCRVGPGRAYEMVGGLLVGEVAEVVGRNAAGNYWIIRNPDRAGTCWLWGEYTILSGNTSLLPIYAPPPTPTPSPTPINFAAAYNGLESCTGTGWWVDLDVENNGGIAFRSIAMTLRDITDNTVVSLYANEFTERTGCNQSRSRNNLPPGVTRIVSSPIFSYDPSGHNLRATITLCEDPRQSGLCITKAVRFTP